jgi:hypothetical protein
MNNTYLTLDLKEAYQEYLKIPFYLVFIVEQLVFLDLKYKRSLKEESSNLFFVYIFLMMNQLSTDLTFFEHLLNQK